MSNPLTPILVLALVFGLPSVGALSGKAFESAQVPLSAEEADAMVQEEAKAKADEKARQRARLLDRSKFQIIEQTEIFTEQEKLTLNRVRPPSLDSPASEEPEVAAEEAPAKSP